MMARWRHLGLFLSIPTLAGAALGWQEWQARKAWAPAALPGPVARAVAPVEPAASPSPAALNTLFGLSGGSAASSGETLQLRAIFVASGGQSRALLAAGERHVTYQVGDRLPGGSVLRRIESDGLVLWRNGREERLALRASNAAKPLAVAGESPRRTVRQTFKPVENDS
jgi:general secretion pathway protein C